MEDEKLREVLAWAEEMSTLQQNLGDRFDFEENTRGKFNLKTRPITENANQKDIATLMEIVNANENNTELRYAPIRDAETDVLNRAVANQLSNSSHSKLATRGMRDASQLPRNKRLAGAQYQAQMLGTGRDALTGAPISMQEFDAGHIRSNIRYPETSNDYTNIRPQASGVNRAAREAEGNELVDRLLNGYLNRLRRR